MDRDTVRLILLVLGILVMAGIYVWGRYRRKILDFVQRRGEFDELALDEPERVEPTVRSGPDEVPARPAAAPWSGVQEAFEEEFAAPAESRQPASSERPDTPSVIVGAPFLIQVSVVARGGEDFSGEELRDAFLDLGLVYGEMGIFHRYDRSCREPQFSVASLVKPGTFPIEDMASFASPGVVLFYQPAQVSDPLAVFDDLFETAHELAEKLDGEEWDESRRLLDDGKVRELRERLEEIYG